MCQALRAARMPPVGPQRKSWMPCAAWTVRVPKVSEGDRLRFFERKLPPVTRAPQGARMPQDGIWDPAGAGEPWMELFTTES